MRRVSVLRRKEPDSGFASDPSLAGGPRGGARGASQYRSPTGISTATVLPGCASGQAHAGSYAQDGL